MYVDIQNACTESLPFSEHDIQSWAESCLKKMHSGSELSLRCVDVDEMHALNFRYRHQDKPTNVLAFPANLPDICKGDIALLGDVIICPDILKKEAMDEGKLLQNHWIHIISHGILHLLGYDHITETDAEIMQGLEIRILAGYGIENPYDRQGESID